MRGTACYSQLTQGFHSTTFPFHFPSDLPKIYLGSSSQFRKKSIYAFHERSITARFLNSRHCTQGCDERVLEQPMHLRVEYRLPADSPVSCVLGPLGYQSIQCRWTKRKLMMIQLLKATIMTRLLVSVNVRNWIKRDSLRRLSLWRHCRLLGWHEGIGGNFLRLFPVPSHSHPAAVYQLGLNPNPQN